MAPTWGRDEVMSIVARVIRRAHAKHHGLVSRDEMRSGLLKDSVGNRIIEKASRKGQGKHSEEWIAMAMIAAFNQRFTRKTSGYEGQFKRTRELPYSYKPVRPAQPNEPGPGRKRDTGVARHGRGAAIVGGVFRSLTDASEIKAAYEKLSLQLRKKTRSFRRTVGWPYGRREVTVWWQEQHRFWAALSPNINPSHYWLAFGLQNPEKHRVMNITCEVNPSRQANVRRSAGVLLKDLNGNVFLGHSGRVGGGQSGVGKEAFLRFYRGETQRMVWNTGNKATFAKVLVFGRIGSPTLLAELGRFAVNVDNFKRGISDDKHSTGELLKIEAAVLESLGVFDPENTDDARQKILASIVTRHGQPRFRKQLFAAYESRCAVTGCDCPETLEAAHIRRYHGDHTNHVTNGLLLRTDLHTLFDLHLISVTGGKTVVVSRRLAGTVYRTLEGKKLKLPKDPRLRPNSDVLAEHLAEMNLDTAVSPVAALSCLAA